MCRPHADPDPRAHGDAGAHSDAYANRPEVTYHDAPGDCLDFANVAAACDPEGIDILSVTITRASPVTIVVELAGTGVVSLPTYALIHGLDLDLDAGTGDTSAWPDLHGMAPDLEVGFSSTDGQVQTVVLEFAPDGTPTTLDPSLAEWTVLDDNHIQVVLSDELIPGESFGIGGDIFVPDRYDHYVDGGHIVFPGGEVVLLQ